MDDWIVVKAKDARVEATGGMDGKPRTWFKKQFFLALSQPAILKALWYIY